ncbi:MAG: chemotaxis protein CheW [Burkholderiaceae bacterium]|jgi:twitching motility protein PilI|nr:chemotaxis protein CheW [Burkholderiaceae bacterium]MEB2319571.1 chemotaxis protein CheW [Pseudomonadota bacterium]
MSKTPRPSLREFQARLNERLEQAAGAGIDARLGLEIGTERWLVELADAGEIVPVPERIVAVPLTHAWFKGLVSLRGALFGVSDLSEFAGKGPTAIGRESRLVSFAGRFGVNAAIIASRMLGLHGIESMTREETDRGDGAVAPWVGATWIDAEGRRWRELSVERLCSDAAFLGIGR